MTHLACPHCAWRRYKTCECPGISYVLRLALHTDGGAILRPFKRDTTLDFWRKGFSLIEVLVATAILATGLIAASRAALVATNDQGILRDRTLARWVAHNTLAEIRLRPQQAQAGSALTQQAQQSGIEFTATARVTATPSPIFSRVEVTVTRAAGDGQILATAVGFSARP